ncbi:cell surface glycoprotein CD200 receptor 1-like [Orycteropus afer afer]|uniref:Cell surface glycoprotein CD200 receptor 1-like n=1 Tax=Orycteropus afer afer TaxID=1230840 RepID=A0A8B7ACD6_ORYAF|nr:cell surface glycoprotein CD200 receptor 1-like [Orycteropus afer afer]
MDSRISSFVDGKQIVENISTPPTEVKTSLTVLVNTKAVLSCPPVPLTPEFIATWKIIFRDNTSCTKAYRRDKNETKETNCTDEAITWASRPDQSPALQIDPVAITHDGSYTCEMVTSNGHFHHAYHVQVLVPPEVTVFLTENRTVVCKAVAGKPAAQISWNPEGDCVTEQENQGNGAVSVRSACHWEDGITSAVTCSVSHLTRNESLSIQLHPVQMDAKAPGKFQFFSVGRCAFCRSAIAEYGLRTTLGAFESLEILQTIALPLL